MVDWLLAYLYMEIFNCRGWYKLILEGNVNFTKPNELLF